MWGPHQHMAHTNGWEYTTEQDRQIREASVGAGGGVLGAAVGKAKSFKGGSKGRLSRKGKHGSQRSERRAELDPERVRGEDDEHSRNATAAVRRSRSERRKDREREQEREKEIERGLRGLPIKNSDEKVGKEKQRAEGQPRSRPEMSEKEKDIG
jgi:hypothetical protein